MPVATEFRYPSSPVFYRRLRRTFPRILRGEGCWLYDDSGKRYLDACGGAYVANLGHGVAEVADAMAAQARRLAYVNATAFTHDPVEELAARIAVLAPGDLDKVFFLCGGSDAVEAALKLSRQYWTEAGKPDKKLLIALRPSYHGNTLLSMSASARPSYKKLFDGWLVDVKTIPAPYPYRCSCRGESADCPVCSGEALERLIEGLGPENVAAFIAEPVGGSSTGCSVPRAGYFKGVREVCDRNQVLFIADEVLTGAGRTGTWSALEPEGVVPDMAVFGKGITGGYAPLSALAAPRRILDVVARGSGVPLINQTFSHHPVSCAAGLAAVKLLTDGGLIARCAEMGPVLHEGLRELRGLPHVGDVRGRGLLAGVEFVEDKETRRPFPRSKRFAETFMEAAQAVGLVVWPNSGQAEGGEGDLAMVAPPFVVTEDEVSEIVRLFRIALEATIKNIQS